MDNTWMDSAACRRLDPDLFFPGRGVSGQRIERAMKVCESCPVLSECCTYRERLLIHTGIWHGTLLRSKSEQALRNSAALRREALAMYEHGAVVDDIASILDVTVALAEQWHADYLRRAGAA